MSVKSKKQIKKAPAKKNVKLSEDGLRLRKLTKRQDKAKTKKQKKLNTIPPARKIFEQSLRQLWDNKKLFIGILLTYGFFYILFVKGISANFQLGNLKQNLNDSLGGKQGAFSTGFALYGLLLGSAGSSSTDQASVYQMILLVIFGLALIRGLRITYKKQASVRVRDVIYKSTNALVPFIIVLFFMLLQILPALIVSSLYSVSRTSAVLAGPVQNFLAFAILMLGLFWSMYMLSSSLFALYIVTLGDTPPRAALKAAKELVKFRRYTIIRRIMFLPLVLLLMSALVLIPLIIIYAPAAEVVFMAFTILVLGIVHSYLYTLYRSIL